MPDHIPYPSELARIYYPPPPWLLQGSGLMTSFLVRASAVETLVPAPLALVRVAGGLALGYMALARYGAGSTLEYSELMAGVVVRHRLRFAPYITHIGVDTEPAQRAGRELWYLPRQIWQFEWQMDQPELGIRVWDGVRLICVINDVPANARLLPLKTSQTFLNLRGTDVALVRSELNIRVATTTWNVQFGPDGPLAPLAPTRRLISMVVKGAAEMHGLEILEK